MRQHFLVSFFDENGEVVATARGDSWQRTSDGLFAQEKLDHERNEVLIGQEVASVTQNVVKQHQHRNLVVKRQKVNFSQIPG